MSAERHRMLIRLHTTLDPRPPLRSTALFTHRSPSCPPPPARPPSAPNAARAAAASPWSRTAASRASSRCRATPHRRQALSQGPLRNGARPFRRLHLSAWCSFQRCWYWPLRRPRDHVGRPHCSYGHSRDDRDVADCAHEASPAFPSIHQCVLSISTASSNLPSRSAQRRTPTRSTRTSLGVDAWPNRSITSSMNCRSGK